MGIILQLGLVLLIASTINAQQAMFVNSLLNSSLDAKSISLGKAVTAFPNSDLAYKINPALLGFKEQSSLYFSYYHLNMYRRDYGDIYSSGIILNTKIGAFSLDYSRYFGLDNISTNFLTPTVGDFLREKTFSITSSYSNYILNNFSLGVSITALRNLQFLEGEDVVNQIYKTHFYFNFGVLYLLKNILFYDKLNVGLSIQNLGGKFQHTEAVTYTIHHHM